jgi:hypothetical protein
VVGWTDAPRGVVCQVGSAGYVARVDVKAVFFAQFVDSAKDRVGSRVAAPPLLPRVDDAMVVSINDYVWGMIF